MTEDIRGLTATDRPSWLPLWRAYQVFYEVDIAPVTDTTWERLLDPREPMFGAVAQAGPDCVGMVHWVFHRTTWSLENTCYLQDLYVTPACRRTGLGTRLIEHVIAVAQARGCPKVYWLTHERNETAMRAYDRVAVRSGFIQYQKILKPL